MSDDSNRKYFIAMLEKALTAASDPRVDLRQSVSELQQQLWFATGAITKGARSERAPGHDVPLNDAMLCWTGGEKAAVLLHPDRTGASYAYGSSVGACFSNWREKDTIGQQLQLMIDAWHIVAFYDVPAETVHRALLVIPEYRSMLAGDCLPEAYRHERE
ncbi:MAG: hypothetical protein V4618_13420 [Pseudomonadota bacterium]